MASNLVCQRHNGSEIRDCPTSWRRRPKVDHTSNNRDTEEVHPLEVSEDLVETDAESLLFDFFSRGCPLHLDREEVA